VAAAAIFALQRGVRRRRLDDCDRALDADTHGVRIEPPERARRGGLQQKCALVEQRAVGHRAEKVGREHLAEPLDVAVHDGVEIRLVEAAQGGEIVAHEVRIYTGGISVAHLKAMAMLSLPRLDAPILTPPRIWSAYTVAVVADALQLLLGPIGWALADEVID